MSTVGLETLGAEDPDPIDAEGAKEAGKVTLAGKSPTQIALQRLRHDKVAVVCAAIVFVMVMLAALAPVITNVMNIYWDIADPNAPNVSEVVDFDGYPLVGPPYHPFTWEHPLGLAPQTGTDNLAYLLYGLRTSLVIAFVATLFSTVIGVALGLMAGFSRGRVDGAISFVTDLFLSFPFLLAMLSIAPIIASNFADNQDLLAKAQFFSLLFVLIIFGWMGLTRLIRGQVLSLREREFIQSAQVVGVPTRKILFKELLPNLIAPIVVATSLALPAFIALEAGLSFLGIGLTGTASLGKMVSDAATYYAKYPLYLWAPVATIALITLTLNLLGDSIRDAFDPKTRR